eukprot:gene17842-19623_t
MSYRRDLALRVAAKRHRRGTTFCINLVLLPAAVFLLQYCNTGDSELLRGVESDAEYGLSRHLLSLRNNTSSNVTTQPCNPPSILEFPTDLFSNKQRKYGAVLIHIAVHLNLTEDVAGATFMAAGSSAPELFTSIIGVFIAHGDIGSGTIIGSAVFNVLVILSLVGVCAGKAVPLTRWPLFRDSVSYSITVAALILVRKLVFIVDVYLLLCTDESSLKKSKSLMKAKFNKKIVAYLKSKAPKKDDTRQKLEEGKSINNQSLPCGLQSPYSAENEEIRLFGRRDRRLTWREVGMMIMLTNRFTPATRFRAAGLIVRLRKDELKEEHENLLFNHEDNEEKTWHIDIEGDIARETHDMTDKEETADEIFVSPRGSVYQTVYWYISLPLIALLHFTIPDCKTARWEKWFMATFLMSVIWIAMFSYILVWMVTVIGYTSGIPDVIMGITFLAAGTSVPDAIASLIVARQGQGDMAVSNSIGSNVFDILIGLALPWLIKTAMYHPGSVVKVNSRGLVYSVMLLFASVIVTENGISSDNRPSLPQISSSSSRLHLTMSTHFRNSLRSLMAKMIHSDPLFVRCIRPNNANVSNRFDEEKVLAQLRYTGVLETSKIRKQGYSERIPFAQFIKRYRNLVYPVTKELNYDADTCRKILKAVGIDMHWRIGRKKVFLKYFQLQQLAELLDTFRRNAMIVQRCIKSWLFKIRYKKEQDLKRKKVILIQKCEESKVVTEEMTNATTIQLGESNYYDDDTAFRSYLARKELKQRKEQREVEKQLKSATALQAVYRGHQDRKSVQEIEEDAAMEDTRMFFFLAQIDLSTKDIYPLLNQTSYPVLYSLRREATEKSKKSLSRKIGSRESVLAVLDGTGDPIQTKYRWAKERFEGSSTPKLRKLTDAATKTPNASKVKPRVAKDQSERRSSLKSKNDEQENSRITVEPLPGSFHNTIVADTEKDDRHNEDLPMWKNHVGDYPLRSAYERKIDESNITRNESQSDFSDFEWCLPRSRNLQVDLDLEERGISSELEEIDSFDYHQNMHQNSSNVYTSFSERPYDELDDETTFMYMHQPLNPHGNSIYGEQLANTIGITNGYDYDNHIPYGERYHAVSVDQPSITTSAGRNITKWNFKESNQHRGSNMFKAKKQASPVVAVVNGYSKSKPEEERLRDPHSRFLPRTDIDMTSVNNSKHDLDSNHRKINHKQDSAILGHYGNNYKLIPTISTESEPRKSRHPLQGIVKAKTVAAELENKSSIANTQQRKDSKPSVVKHEPHKLDLKRKLLVEKALIEKKADVKGLPMTTSSLPEDEEEKPKHVSGFNYGIPKGKTGLLHDFPLRKTGRLQHLVST